MKEVEFKKGDTIIVVSTSGKADATIVHNLKSYRIVRVNKWTLNCGSQSFHIGHFRNRGDYEKYSFWLPEDKGLEELVIKWFENKISIEKENIAKAEQAVANIQNSILSSEENIARFEEKIKKIKESAEDDIQSGQQRED